VTPRCHVATAGRRNTLRVLLKAEHAAAMAIQLRAKEISSNRSPTRQPIRTPVSGAFENKSSRRSPFARTGTYKSAGVLRSTQRPDRSLLEEGYRYSSRMLLIVSSDPFE